MSRRGSKARVSEAVARYHARPLADDAPKRKPTSAADYPAKLDAARYPPKRAKPAAPRAKLRDRWVGTRMPAFDRDLPRPERWAVYVFELPSAVKTWYVVGRLLQRPWSRVGGGGEHDTSTEASPQARAAAQEWLARVGLLKQRVWFPMGSLLIPDKASVSDLKPYSAKLTDWRPQHTFDSLAAARKAAQRMADVLCPREQTRLTWPGRCPAELLRPEAVVAPTTQAETVPAERVHSASSIALALDCRRAWAHCYVDKVRKPEVQWEQVLEYQAWQESVGGYRAARGMTLPEGIVEPVGGQRSAACGTRTHLYAAWYVTGAATADADVYGPRRLIDWESLPGQVLQSMLPHLPPAGSVAPENAEAEFELEVAGVKFKGLIDILSVEAAEVWDHKTTRDVCTYALLPASVADAAGVPERSLKSNLQACLYAVHCAKQTDPPAASVTCRWTYGETDRVRRALPVVQEIPYSHALGVVESAADVARTLTYASSEEAPPNTLSCDKYGGCWYRGRLCKVRRDYGRIALQLEKEDTMAASKRPMTFAELQKATAEAAAASKPGAAPKAATKPAAAAPAPAKKFTPKPPAAAPAPELEETEEEQTDEGEAVEELFTIAQLAKAVLETYDAHQRAMAALREALAAE